MTKEEQKDIKDIGAEIKLEGTGEHNGHSFVDLGLPSGTLWATCNVGAYSAGNYGDYFAWGETQPKKYYSRGTYKWCNKAWDKLTKYCDKTSCGNKGFVDNLTTLEACDDAATTNWGDGWRTPSPTEIQELIDNCSCGWRKLNRTIGLLFTGPNGNSIFLPAGGSRMDGGRYGVGESMNYLTNSLCSESGYPSFARLWVFGTSRPEPTVCAFNHRDKGYLVRPVCSVKD